MGHRDQPGVTTGGRNSPHTQMSRESLRQTQNALCKCLGLCTIVYLWETSPGRGASRGFRGARQRSQDLKTGRREPDSAEREEEGGSGNRASRRAGREGPGRLGPAVEGGARCAQWGRGRLQTTLTTTESARSKEPPELTALPWRGGEVAGVGVDAGSPARGGRPGARAGRGSGRGWVSAGTRRVPCLPRGVLQAAGSGALSRGSAKGVRTSLSQSGKVAGRRPGRGPPPSCSPPLSPPRPPHCTPLVHLPESKMEAPGGGKAPCVRKANFCPAPRPTRPGSLARIVSRDRPRDNGAGK